MTDDLGRGIDARADIEQDDTVSGAAGAETRVGQMEIVIAQPAAGETVTIAAEAGQSYIVAFDPEAAQVRIQGNDLVLRFPDGGQVVFANLDTVAQGPDAPVFEIAGQSVAGDVIYAQVAALAEGADAPSFETAAGQGVQGTGETRYDDDTGQLIDLLNPEGVIPPVELAFGLIAPGELPLDLTALEPTPALVEDDIPQILSVDGVSVDEDDIVVQEEPNGERLARLLQILDDQQEPGSDTLDRTRPPIDPPGSQPTIVSGNIVVDFGDDMPGSIALTTAGLPALTSSTNDLPLVYTPSPDGLTITATAGGETVFVVTVGPASSDGTFTYTFELLGSINHPEGLGENIAAIPLQFVVTDSNGDTATGALNVSLRDDVPAIALDNGEGGDAANIKIWESQIDNGDLQDLRGSFNGYGNGFGTSGAAKLVVVFGADGPESSKEGSGEIELALTNIVARDEDGTEGGDQGLNGDLDGAIPFGTEVETDLESGGETVYVRMEGPRTVVGFIKPNADQTDDLLADSFGEFGSFYYGDYGPGTVFVATVDLFESYLIDGVYKAPVTFTLLRPLDHPDNDNPDTPGNESEVMIDDLIRFTFDVTVRDDDGDTATQSVTVDVDDDGPTISGQSEVGTVDEDDLNGAQSASVFSTGTSPDADTNLDGSVSATGSLTSLVDFGADQPGSFNLLTDTSAVTPVTSKGDGVTYAVVGDTLTATADGTVSGDGVRTVFTLELLSDGTYTYTQFDQLDHDSPASGADENTMPIDFSSLILAQDFDGDSVRPDPGSFTITVVDDVPVAAIEATAEITVFEDALGQGAAEAPADSSTGILDNDGDGIADVDPEADEATFSAAQLQGLVVPGADEPVTFGLDLTVSGAVLTTGGAAVESKGKPVLFGTVGGAVIGFVDGNGSGAFNAGDRVVFTLTQNAGPDGIVGTADDTFTFDLDDQLDHAGGGDLATLRLDLTAAFSAVDFDGDAVTLNPASVRVAVENDVPAVGGDPLTGVVEEEHLGLGNEDTLPAEDGDTDVTPPGSEETTEVASGSLSSLVEFGADRPGRFGLSANTSGLPQDLTSQGEPVLYQVNAAGNVLRGFVDNNMDGEFTGGGVDRLVFLLNVQSNADYTFTLVDQLDHAAPAAGTAVEDILEIDFSSVIEASDLDGDTVTLSGGAFTIKVIDDVPVQVGGTTRTGVVEEEHLPGGNEDSTSVPDLDKDTPGDFDQTTTVASQSLFSLVSFGADRPGMFELSAETGGLTAQGLTSQGDDLLYTVDPTGTALTATADENGNGVVDSGERTVFTLAMSGTSNATYTFTLLDQLDHHPLAAADDIEGLLEIDFSSVIEVRDYDGDTITLSAGTFMINVIDDIPDEFAPDAAILANSQSAAATEALDVFDNVGADQNGSVIFAGGSDGDNLLGSIGGDPIQELRSNGHDILLSGFGGDALTAFADNDDSGDIDPGDTIVFTATADPGTDTYTITMLNTIDNGGELVDFSLGVALQDFDGDATAGALSITLAPPLLIVGSNEDDDQNAPPGDLAFDHVVPNPITGNLDGVIEGLAGDDVLVGDPGGAFASLNVVYVLDVSSSMGLPTDPNSRLSLARDAFVNLTNVFAGFANQGAAVTINIVLFATTAVTLGRFTDPLDAIAALEGIDRGDTGGNTNYKAALDVTRFVLGDTAANPPAKLNSVYFLSDGDPTIPFPVTANTNEGIADFNAFVDDYQTGGGAVDPGARLDVHAVGISPIGDEGLTFLDQFDNTGGGLFIDDPADLTATLAATIELSSLGEDVILGNDGNDLLFGDVPNTDQLAIDEGLSLLPGTGWSVFEALEAGQGTTTPDWDRGDTLTYLTDPANFAELTATGRGEADLIDGGAGNDIIFGQGGDDTIIGGLGDDELTGGAGADTFVFSLSGPDEGVDTIGDFSVSEDDILSFTNVDENADGVAGLSIDDVIDTNDPGTFNKVGDTVTVELRSGTMITITDIDNAINDLNDLAANSSITGV